MPAAVASAYVDLVPNTKNFGAGVGKAIAAAGIGAALFKFGKDSVKAFSDAEEGQRSLQFAFKKFPKLASTNIGSLRGLNTELQKKTKFDDDNIASGQAVLAQFSLTGQQIKGVTPLLLDYAAATGKDIPGAAKDVGKALLGNTKALKNIGISYKTTGNKTKDFTNITDLMRQKVGGFAETEGTTAAGKLAILRNQFGELQETVGSKLLPVLTKVVAFGLKMVAWISKNQKVLLPLVVAFASAVATFKILTTVVRIYTAVQLLLNSALFSNPIGLVVLAIAALIGFLVLAYQKSATFHKIVDAAFRAIAAAGKFMWENVLKPTFKFLVSAFLAVAGAIVHGAAMAFGWVPGLGGKLKAAAAKFDDFRDSVNRALDGTHSKKDITVSTPGMRKALDDLATLRLRTLNIPRSVTVGVGNKLRAANLEHRASGGPVVAGRGYLVGENGPEPFYPTTNGTILPHGTRPSGGGLHVHGNVYGADAAAIVDEQERREQRKAALYPVYA